MNSNKKQLAVIGAGIAGLSFAHCLGGDDYDITLFEKKPLLDEIGAAISVFPNALRVLEHVGLLPAILDNSGPMPELILKTDKGRILARAIPEAPYPVVCMHRATLQQVLSHQVPARIVCDHSLSRIEALPGGQTALHFSHGDTQVFDAVIGADGIRSKVREYVLDDGLPIYRGYNVWRGILDTPSEAGYGSETYGTGRRVGIVPIRKGTLGWWATANEPFQQDDEPEGTRQKLLRLFGDWHDPIPELMLHTPHIIKNSLSDRIPRRGWSKGLVTLLGDAAHPTTPNLGQGGCMAMEGAYLLAAAIRQYGLSEAAFARYEALQFPRAQQIVSESLRLGRIGQLSQPWLVALRNTAFSLTPSAVTVKLMSKHFNYDVTRLRV